MGIDTGSEIRSRLIVWFSENGRTFIWRHDPAPFTVLIAELLLRKTRPPAVNVFIGGFLTRFPDASALAAADLLELAALLQPLGLARQRAYQMKRLGEALTALPGRDIPKTRDGLLALPGVGPYTAAAVLCFAHGRAEPLVDTNVARIIVRIYGIARPSRFEARRSPEIWERAGDLIGNDDRNARSVNWALLDLGAAVCRTRNPTCIRCPLGDLCTYSQSTKITRDHQNRFR